MTILLVGVCENGLIRKAGKGHDGQREVGGITSAIPCEKCGGKGCPKPAREAEAESEQDPRQTPGREVG